MSALQNVSYGSVTRCHPWTPVHKPPSLNQHKVGRVVMEEHCTDNGLVTQILSPEDGSTDESCPLTDTLSADPH